MVGCLGEIVDSRMMKYRRQTYYVGIAKSPSWMEEIAVKNFCRIGLLYRSGKRWLVLLLSACLIGAMLPVTARAESGNYHEENVPLTLGEMEYNNNRYLCLPDTIDKEVTDSNWSDSNPGIVELGSQKYFDTLGYCKLARAKSVGETTVTCTYKVDEVDYTCVFNITVAYPDINNNKVSFTLEKVQKVYDGQSISLSAPQRVSSLDGGTVRFEYSDDGGATWVRDRNSITATNCADSRVIKVRVSVPGVYNGYLDDSQKFDIRQRPVSLSSGSLTKEYDGNPLTNGDTTVSVSGGGWAEGEGADYNFTGSQTTVGTSENKFDVMFRAGTDRNNYDITKNYGTFEITKRRITVKAKSATVTRDGTRKSVSGFESLEFNINGNKFTVSGLSAEASGTAAGTYPVVVSGEPVVRDAHGNDVTSQFEVSTANGTLTIVNPSNNSDRDNSKEIGKGRSTSASPDKDSASTPTSPDKNPPPTPASPDKDPAPTSASPDKDPASTPVPATPALGTDPAPGTGNNNKPGSKPVTNTGETTEAPFIRGENGKEGWDVIRDEVNQTQEGKTVTVDMNGSTVVPGDVLDEIKGKDITIVFDMGNGITWSINGQSIMADRVSDIDFTVTTGTNTIPVDIINNVTGERYSTQISLAYEGEFGFTAVLSINMDAKNAGFYANLFYYNEKTGDLEFICYDEIAADGTAELVFTHASDYAIVIDTEPMDKGVDKADGSKAEVPGTGNDNTQTGSDSTQPGTEAPDSTWNPLWLLLIGAVVIVIGLGVFLVRKKKKSEDE